MAAKYENYTVEDARTESVEDALDMFKVLKSAFTVERKKGEKLMIAAAYATHAVLHVKAKTRKDLIDDWGKSGTLITLYGRLGKVAADLNWVPGTDEWEMLANQNGALVGQIGRLIDNKQEVADDEGKMRKVNLPLTEKEGQAIKDMIAIAFEKRQDGSWKKHSSKDIDAKIAGTYVEPGTSTPGRGGAGGEGGDGAEAPEPIRTNAGQAREGIRMIRKVVAELSDEEWSKFYPAFAALVEQVDQQVEARSKVTKTA